MNPSSLLTSLALPASGSGHGRDRSSSAASGDRVSASDLFRRQLQGAQSVQSMKGVTAADGAKPEAPPANPGAVGHAAANSAGSDNAKRAGAPLADTRLSSQDDGTAPAPNRLADTDASGSPRAAMLPAADEALSAAGRPAAPRARSTSQGRSEPALSSLATLDTRSATEADTPSQPDDATASRTSADTRRHPLGQVAVEAVSSREAADRDSAQAGTAGRVQQGVAADATNPDASPASAAAGPLALRRGTRPNQTTEPSAAEPPMPSVDAARLTPVASTPVSEISGNDAHGATEAASPSKAPRTSAPVLAKPQRPTRTAPGEGEGHGVGRSHAGGLAPAGATDEDASMGRAAARVRATPDSDPPESASSMPSQLPSPQALMPEALRPASVKAGPSHDGRATLSNATLSSAKPLTAHDALRSQASPPNDRANSAAHGQPGSPSGSRTEGDAAPVQGTPESPLGPGLAAGRRLSTPAPSPALAPDAATAGKGASGLAPTPTPALQTAASGGWRPAEGTASSPVSSLRAGSAATRLVALGTSGRAQAAMTASAAGAAGSPATPDAEAPRSARPGTVGTGGESSPPLDRRASAFSANTVSDALAGLAAASSMAGGKVDSTALYASVAASVPTAVIQITPNIDSPAFASALASQVAVLVRDGIQRAEVRLNPAEMGPVQVRIAIDGRDARIEFQADVATTRQALEASLPQLAGSMREAGFVLAGGGVSTLQADGSPPTASSLPQGGQAGANSGGGQSQSGADRGSSDTGSNRSGNTAGARADPGSAASRLDIGSNAPGSERRSRAASGGLDLYA